MKIINDSKKISVALSNKEIVEITIEGNNSAKIVVKCFGNTLHIEESLDTINDKIEEEKAILAMDKYLKKRKKTEKSTNNAKEIKK